MNKAIVRFIRNVFFISKSKLCLACILVSLSLVFLVGCSFNKDDISESDNNQEGDVIDEKTDLEIKTEFIDKKISEMSLNEKIGQLFIVEYRKNENGSNITEINNDIKQSIKEYKLGGVILFSENIDTKEQTSKFIEDLQKSSHIPLFIGVDEEGGRVSRLSKSGKMGNYNVPAAGVIGEGGDTALAYDMYKIIGEELAELGFNLDFAPIADINTNPENTVIGDRAFGREPEKTGEMVVMAMKGLEEAGISAVLKHFPGHGDTSTDTHNSEAIVEHNLERLEQVEFVPFKMGIDEGVNFVMVGHMKTPLISKENLPAVMSKEIVTEILRSKLGFNGIVITDALNMGAISEHYSTEEVVVKAVNAGVDILLMPYDFKVAYNALILGVENGDILEETIDKAVFRIFSVKYDKNLL